MNESILSNISRYAMGRTPHLQKNMCLSAGSSTALKSCPQRSVERLTTRGEFLGTVYSRVVSTTHNSGVSITFFVSRYHKGTNWRDGESHRLRWAIRAKIGQDADDVSYPVICTETRAIFDGFLRRDSCHLWFDSRMDELRWHTR